MYQTSAIPAQATVEEDWSEGALQLPTWACDPAWVGKYSRSLPLIVYLLTRVDGSGIALAYRHADAANYLGNAVSTIAQQFRLLRESGVITVLAAHQTSLDIQIEYHVKLSLGDLTPKLNTNIPRLSWAQWGKLRTQVFIRDDYTCQYCGWHVSNPHCDHVRPISRGGTNELGNLVTACATCNLSKKDKTLEEWQS